MSAPEGAFAAWDDYVPPSERPNPKTSILSEIERNWAIHALAADRRIHALQQSLAGLLDACKANQSYAGPGPLFREVAVRMDDAAETLKLTGHES